VISFKPESLKAELEAALQVLKRVTDTDLDDLLDEAWNAFSSDLSLEDEDETEITSETDVFLSLPRVEQNFETTVAGTIELASELKDARLVDNLECWTSKRFLLRVEPLFTDESFRLFDSLAGESRITAASTAPIKHDGCDIECRLVEGITPFAFLVTGQSYWDKYFPPVLDGDLFIEVSFDGRPTDEALKHIASAYIFELSATCGLDLRAAARPDNEGLVNDDPAEGVELKLRDLVLSPALKPVLDLFNAAIAIPDNGSRILYFSKVFEHISQTVVRAKLVETARAKLLSPRAINPSANYINELEDLFEQHRIFRKDRDAIILTVAACCEPTELSHLAPNFLKELAGLSSSAGSKERDDALRKLGAAVVATRNAIAHAKCNYSLTGEECPDEQMPAFTECLKLATAQAIRWFADRPEKFIS
jgi:hypothetical protein